MAHPDSDNSAVNPLLDVIDSLNEASHLLQAAFMAASDLTVECQGAMKAVIGCAAEKLEAALEDLEGKRKEIANV